MLLFESYPRESDKAERTAQEPETSSPGRTCSEQFGSPAAPQPEPCLQSAVYQPDRTFLILRRESFMLRHFASFVPLSTDNGAGLGCERSREEEEEPRGTDHSVGVYLRTCSPVHRGVRKEFLSGKENRLLPPRIHTSVARTRESAGGGRESSLPSSRVRQHCPVRAPFTAAH